MLSRPRLAPRLAAFLTAAVGLMNVVSALYPAIHARMEILRDLLPVHLIRSSQTAAVLVGFALIVLADGLRKRRRRALYIVVSLLLISAVLNLTKGLDFEESTAALLLATALIRVRSAFAIPGRPAAPQRVIQRLATFGLLYYTYVLVGFLILRRVIVPAPTFWTATQEPFRLLLDASIFHYQTAQAAWFGRSIVVVGCVAILYSVLQVLRPFIPWHSATHDDVRRARDILERYGGDALSYFALQDGRSYFFHESGEAFLSYRLWDTVALVGGDPVGDPRRMHDLIRSFAEFAESNSMDLCFLGVGTSTLALYESCGFRTLKIGEEAVIDLPGFDPAVLKRKVRRAVRHIHDAGIEARVYRRDQLPQAHLDQMEEISAQWVRGRGGSEKGFSMTLGRLPRPSDRDCQVVVAVEGERVWGYLCFVPVYSRGSLSLDAMRRRPESPNGLMEFLVISAAEAFRDRGYSALSLNFATLSNAENDIDSRALEGTRRFLFENLSSYYQLKSLYQFNCKFGPRWNSRYLAYRDVLRLPRVALAVVQSEDPVRLPSLAIFRR